jgi:hypothetical protein
MIAAFDLRAIEFAAGERHSTMRTGIAQSERIPLGVAPNDQRNSQQHGLPQIIS